MSYQIDKLREQYREECGKLFAQHVKEDRPLSILVPVLRQEYKALWQRIWTNRHAHS